ncbi:hypothetical protein FPL06_09620 [Xanthomonas citri pv. glycines]|nr:hypothetical protein BHE84_24265 [Xanthomonas citri pv. glycines str. 8ra]QDR47629.1 hypothetical protein FPK90_16320 [Xanthomonas citri pv. glycines]QDS09602.1 hypothetical protein FPL00_15215 [Xanthomonas citri pv. glycines]QDS14009.1 hypothetical protein FPL03_15560 [Xanthomonas citri pv. glycines]QDS22650.1 hypothetical protein FPL05_15880 [Xanthomonas citri pv. glycines]
MQRIGNAPGPVSVIDTDDASVRAVTMPAAYGATAALWCQAARDLRAYPSWRLTPHRPSRAAARWPDRPACRYPAPTPGR